MSEVSKSSGHKSCQVILDSCSEIPNNWMRGHCVVGDSPVFSAIAAAEVYR
jgi:hypothetical protein